MCGCALYLMSMVCCILSLNSMLTLLQGEGSVISMYMHVLVSQPLCQWPVGYWWPEESWPAPPVDTCVFMSMCKGVYQQLEQGCCLEGLNTQMKASGESGIQKQHVYENIYIFSLVVFHPAQLVRGAGWGCQFHLYSYSVHVCNFCGWWCTQVYMWCICVLCLCTDKEYMLSLTTHWIWRYRAAAALPVSGCWIWASSSNTLPCSSMSYLRCISLLFFSLRFFTFSNSLLFSDSTITSSCCHCQTVFCCCCPLHCSYHLWITGRRNLSGHKLWISAGDIPCSVTSLGIANPWLWFHGVSPNVWGKAAWEAAILCLMCCAGSIRVSLYVQWGWLTSGRETFKKPHREHLAESTGAISVVKVCQDLYFSYQIFYLIRYANKTCSFHYPLKQLCDCNLKA